MMLYAALHPIEKKIVFDSFGGKQYSDNPRAVSEKMHELYPDYRIMWNLQFFEDGYGILPDYVEVIDGRKRNRFYNELATAFCYVTNEDIGAYIYKRKNQFFVQTWHGDRAFKKILADIPKSGTIPLENKYADICVAGSDYGERQFRTAFKYEGEILKVGTPRDDVLTENDENKKQRIIERLNLPKNAKYLLYAPTFKDNNSNEAQFNEELSISKTVAAFKEKTGDKWIALSRAHSAAGGGIKYTEEDKKCIIDVSKYPDMSDILLISDALITDYSSSPGDAALKNIPIILFQNEQYSRPLYFDMSASPFYVAHSQAELQDIILSLDFDKVADNCREILDFYKTYESGKAAETVAERINSEFSKRS